MAGEKEIIQPGKIEIRFLLEGKDSNGQLAMFEFTVPAGAKVPVPHSHKRYDETIGEGIEEKKPLTLRHRSIPLAP